jgi:glycosyltransferase involved in cell wall biosynthesis
MGTDPSEASTASEDGSVPVSPLRVLHLFSNCKWTGPAEPALNLCLALRRRGVEAEFACAPEAGSSVNKIVETARDRGLEPVLDFRLNKHLNPWHNFLDRRVLRRRLDAHPVDLIHCHLDNDHDIAVAPARERAIPVVRSSYEGLGFRRDARRARLLAHAAMVLEPSEIARQADAQVPGVDAARLVVVPGAIDTERFDPRRDTPDGRRWLNLPRDAFVVGIVARMQTHRHYEDLFQAIARMAAADPRVHLVVIGRGSRQDKVGFEPVRRLGLEKTVHFTGYIDGENYAGMLKAFDAGVFLVPGSDGTCRAAREILATGRPMVVADRGMLREIVTDGLDGMVFDGTADGLHTALCRLRDDRTLRLELGRNARHTAETRYSLDAQAALVEQCYRRVLGQTSR